MELKQLFAAHPEVLLNRQLTRGVLVDCLENNIAQVNALMLAYDSGILTAIRGHNSATPAGRGRMILTLTDRYSMVEAKAAWAVDCWLSCVTAGLLEELDKARAAQNASEPPPPEPPQPPRTTPETGLHTHTEDFYVNPKPIQDSHRVYVPCGMGNTDCGFFIHGIRKQPMCRNRHGNVYALVYNFLTRSTHVDIPCWLKARAAAAEPDYRSIYRLSIMLLQLLRHNQFSDNVLELNYLGEAEHLSAARELIDHYALLFCRLLELPGVHLALRQRKSGIRLSLSKCDGVWCESAPAMLTNARELWFGSRLNYRLTTRHRQDLEYLLSEISPFDTFKEGQLEALGDLLSARGSAVCIMPTGSGKSLIYYLASLLQPLPMFVVAPTEILIADQLRNLRNCHHMDNAAHLRMTDADDFHDFTLCNSLNYLTPMTLQSRHLLVHLRHMNNGTALQGALETQLAPGPLLSGVVLDEVHCLSNWGHDFRAEYVMLSGFLRKYLDRVWLWGFTATANFTVVEDVQRQLDVPQEHIFSPVTFEKYLISYDYRCYDAEQALYTAAADLARSLARRGERTLLFTKSEAISRRLAAEIGCEADFYSDDDPQGYHHFADGKCDLLITGQELGVGVNLPNVRNVIHFGLPLSKSAYVQQIGRAGRANEPTTSYVLYLKGEGNAPAELLSRSTPVSHIPSLLEGLHNDYAHTYRLLTNNCPTADVLLGELKALQETLEGKGRAYTGLPTSWKELEKTKQLLYMLFATGYVYDWYTYAPLKDGTGVELLVDICSSQGAEKNALRRMRSRLRDHFDALGNHRESIARVSHANTVAELLGIYVDWYYIRYLYHHSEEFLDLYDFILTSTGGDREKISRELSDYFVLPFVKLKSDEAHFGAMTTKEIIAKALTGVSRETMVSLEKINANRYSYRLDLLLLCTRLRADGRLEHSRLERILSRVPAGERGLIPQALEKLYPLCAPEGKLALVNYLHTNGSRMGLPVNEFLTRVYADGRKDLIYYGILARRIDPLFRKRGR